jgi:uncharacterized protein
MPVRVSSDLELPNNAVTQKFAFIARSSAGKSYGASKLAEGLLTIGAQVIVLDPVDTWYGLRLNASGKGRGFSIPVFGGQHGDVPLHVHQGDGLANLLVENNYSAVIDLSRFRKNERRSFVTNFAESLFYYRQEKRAARMLIVEEAQVFAPQRVGPGEERMLGAMEDLCRLGRNFGIGTTLISQRPQSINMRNNLIAREGERLVVHTWLNF